jgi:hypothetical protein
MKENKEYYSAKSFSMMKTRCEYDEEKQSIFISSVDSSFVVCVQCDRKIESYLTTRDSFKAGRFFEEMNIKESDSPKTSVYPLCYMKAASVSGGDCRFYIGVGKSKEQIRAACEKEKRKHLNFSKEQSNIDPLLLSKIASKILYNKTRETENEFLPIRRELWKKGISGDYPVFALYIKDFSVSQISEYIKAYVICHRAHLKYELFIFFEEEDFYFRKTENFLSSIIYKSGAGSLKDKNPGIRLLNVSASKELFEAKDSYASF